LRRSHVGVIKISFDYLQYAWARFHSIAWIRLNCLPLRMFDIEATGPAPAYVRCVTQLWSVSTDAAEQADDSGRTDLAEVRVAGVHDGAVFVAPVPEAALVDDDRAKLAATWSRGERPPRRRGGGVGEREEQLRAVLDDAQAVRVLCPPVASSDDPASIVKG